MTLLKFQTTHPGPVGIVPDAEFSDLQKNGIAELQRCLELGKKVTAYLQPARRPAGTPRRGAAPIVNTDVAAAMAGRRARTTPADQAPNEIVARWRAMPAGPERQAFYAKHADLIWAHAKAS